LKREQLTFDKILFEPVPSSRTKVEEAMHMFVLLTREERCFGHDVPTEFAKAIYRFNHAANNLASDRRSWSFRSVSVKRYEEKVFVA
jgi:hypothetical protein